MNPRLRKLLPWVAYPTFYLFCFALFSYFTFPYDRLRDRIVVSFAEDQRKTGGTMRLEIDRLTSYWFTGVEAEGVRLISPPSPNPDGTLGKGSQIEIDHATARLAVLPLLIGRVKVNFSVQALGGSIDGYSQKSGQDQKLEVDLDKLGMGDFQPFTQLVGLPVTGQASGHLDLAMPEGKMSKATGAIRLTIADFSVGDGKAKIKDAIALPRMVVGDLTFESDVAEGTLKITKCAASGQDLDFSADGKLNLRDPFADSQSDMFLKFRFSDKYKGKDDKTKALFGTPGSNAPALFELADPKIRQSKRADGFYSWRAWGLVHSLRFDPSPTGGASPAGASPGTAGAPGVRGFMR